MDKSSDTAVRGVSSHPAQRSVLGAAAADMIVQQLGTKEQQSKASPSKHAFINVVCYDNEKDEAFVADNDAAAALGPAVPPVPVAAVPQLVQRSQQFLELEDIIAKISAKRMALRAFITTIRPQQPPTYQATVVVEPKGDKAPQQEPTVVEGPKVQELEHTALVPQVVDNTAEEEQGGCNQEELSLASSPQDITVTTTKQQTEQTAFTYQHQSSATPAAPLLPEASKDQASPAAEPAVQDSVASSAQEQEVAKTYNKTAKLVNLHLATGPAGQLIVTLTPINSTNSTSSSTSSVKGEATKEFKPVESFVHTSTASPTHKILTCELNVNRFNKHISLKLSFPGTATDKAPKTKGVKVAELFNQLKARTAAVARPRKTATTKTGPTPDGTPAGDKAVTCQLHYNPGSDKVQLTIRPFSAARHPPKAEIIKVNKLKSGLSAVVSCVRKAAALPKLSKLRKVPREHQQAHSSEVVEGGEDGECSGKPGPKASSWVRKLMKGGVVRAAAAVCA